MRHLNSSVGAQSLESEPTVTRLVPIACHGLLSRLGFLFFYVGDMDYR